MSGLLARILTENRENGPQVAGNGAARAGTGDATGAATAGGAVAAGAVVAGGGAVPQVIPVAVPVNTGNSTNRVRVVTVGSDASTAGESLSTTDHMGSTNGS